MKLGRKSHSKQTLTKQLQCSLSRHNFSFDSVVIKICTQIIRFHSTLYIYMCVRYPFRSKYNQVIPLSEHHTIGGSNTNQRNLLLLIVKAFQIQQSKSFSSKPVARRKFWNFNSFGGKANSTFIAAACILILCFGSDGR